MSKISKAQIKIIYGIASSAGLVDNSKGHEDKLHQIVFGITGKESVKKLSFTEYRKVKNQLKEYALTESVADGMITVKQKAKIYVMMKQLAKLDPSETGIDERLCGIVRKNLKISSFPSEPLKWMRKKEATKIIQILGHYIENEKKKKISKGDAENDGYG